ncbi:MAG: helix-turn-helix transcriptional regulator [Candidatus Vogelbacteria bacterium]
MKNKIIKKVSKKDELKFYTFDEAFGKYFRSKKFQKAYDEELARLKLAHQIRTMRRYQKLTQKETAKKARMPQSVIARIESGTHGYSLGTLSRIASVFNKEIQLV